MKFSREWCMPSPDTFSIKPVKELLLRYIPQGEGAEKPTLRVLDPFARNNKWGTTTNDLNPDTEAHEHLDAILFLDKIYCSAPDSGLYDVVLLDPPYSPRQISECYQSVGRKVTMKDTQSANLYKECKDRMDKVLKKDGIAICFGWNSTGFGIKRGYELIEILLICHGGAHQDTIVTVERKL